LQNHNIVISFFIVIFFVYLIISITADIPELITSIDSEGRNIDLLRIAPINMGSVIYSKMILHFIMLSIIAMMTSVVFFLLLRLPLLYLLITILFVLCISSVFTVIRLGATVFHPRFDWQHNAEVGGNYKAYMFRISEYLYLFTIFNIFVIGFVLLKYLGVQMTFGLLTFLVVSIVSLVSFIFVYVYLHAIDKRLRTW